MSRKDTIIIAVLVNAGLLIILFASALKSSPSQSEYAAATSTVPVDSPSKNEVALQHTPLNDSSSYAFKPSSDLASSTSVQTTPSLPVLPSTASPSQVINFVDDLKSFATSETPPAAPLLQAVVENKSEMPSHTEIKVKKGDVLEKIAKQHHTKVSEIIALNKLSTTALSIGQTLKIPRKNAIAESSAPASIVTTSSAQAPKYYIVKAGDNPWTIAVKNHMKVDELLKLNHLDQEKARKLKPGDKLRVK